MLFFLERQLSPERSITNGKEQIQTCSDIKKQFNILPRQIRENSSACRSKHSDFGCKSFLARRLIAIGLLTTHDFRSKSERFLQAKEFRQLLKMFRREATPQFSILIFSF